MALIPLATEDTRVRPGLPGSRLVNLYIVPTPNGPTKFALIDRPGLARHLNFGGLGVRGIFRKAGVFDANLFTVVDTTVYREGISIGTVADNDTDARMAASDTELVIVSGGYAYVYNGTTLAQITDPDLPAVSDVAYLAGRFIYAQQGSDVFYWSAIGSAGSISGLDFATAESSPDQIRAIEVIGDDLMFFGGDSTEVWNPSSDADAPYIRSSGRRYDKGILGRTAAMLDNAPFWLGSDRRVYRGGAVPQGVSTEGLEERFAYAPDLTQANAYGAIIKGQAFYVINLPGVGTWAYQISQNRWAEWASHEAEMFRPSCAVSYQGVTYFGDRDTGNVWVFNDGLYADQDEPLTRAVGAFAPMVSGTVRNTNISLLSAKGVGSATGQGVAPVVEMRYSDVVDANWSPWMQQPLGVMGDRSIKTTWWQLGLIQAPGRAFEFKITDPVPFTAYGVTINEPRP